ncbi:MAG: adenosylcobinamide amidohydrolase [Vicinamibacterales bacterium]
MSWEVLLQQPAFLLRRRGRFLVTELTGPCRVMSTSVQNGGQTDRVRFLLNHQSCEGAGHHELHRLITEVGHEEYHRRTCVEASLPAEQTAMMGTAANMHYAAVATETDLSLSVTAVVTGGVETNATCAGDSATWRETQTGFEKIPAYAGTINTMLVVNAPLTDSALARAVVTMTEGKSAALQRLAVPSRQSSDLATGTGTDQYCIAVVAGQGALSSTSPHVKLGELIGRAVRTATLEALRWQNGLEPSYTRGIFHALGRYGLTEATFIDDMAPLLETGQLELLRKNMKALTYEPLVGASAHALAAVLDRTRHGALPMSIERDAAVQHAATLAVNVATSPDRWSDFRGQLHELVTTEPKALVLAALALGWSQKWRSR